MPCDRLPSKRDATRTAGQIGDASAFLVTARRRARLPGGESSAHAWRPCLSERREGGSEPGQDRFCRSSVPAIHLVRAIGPQPGGSRCIPAIEPALGDLHRRQIAGDHRGQEEKERGGERDEPEPPRGGGGKFSATLSASTSATMTALASCPEGGGHCARDQQDEDERVPEVAA